MYEYSQPRATAQPTAHFTKNLLALSQSLARPMPNTVTKTPPHNYSPTTYSSLLLRKVININGAQNQDFLQLCECPAPTKILFALFFFLPSVSTSSPFSFMHSCVPSKRHNCIIPCLTSDAALPATCIQPFRNPIRLGKALHRPPFLVISPPYRPLYPPIATKE